jgi:hypothetical protein
MSQRDAKKAQLLEEYKSAAAKRHRTALKHLNEAKEKQRKEEKKVRELKKKIRVEENTRTRTYVILSSDL